MIRQLGHALTRYRNTRRNAAILHGLSDYQLADLGLIRADIARLAKGAR